eukprot:gene3378-biopygen1433
MGISVGQDASSVVHNLLVCDFWLIPLTNEIPAYYFALAKFPHVIAAPDVCYNDRLEHDSWFEVEWIIYRPSSVAWWAWGIARLREMPNARSEPPSGVK